MIKIIPMTTESFNKAVPFITRLQQQKEHYIGYFDTEESAIHVYIKNLEPDWQTTSLLAYKDDQLVGVIIAEYDLELSRAWIHGPMVEDQPNWHEIADQLYEKLMQEIIPKTITDYELYGGKANHNLATFAQRHQFPAKDPSVVLMFPRAKLETLPKITDIHQLTSKYYDQFKKLHTVIFPKTYYSGEQLLKQLDETNQIFIEIINNKLIGFIHIKVEKSLQEGYIEFVGVEESARGQGIGKKLVITALQWLFITFSQISTVNLTVSQTNVSALAVYTKVGFEPVIYLQGYRKREISI
jgi:ribosomal protein S18 acetylase RimI-like enzyme